MIRSTLPHTKKSTFAIAGPNKKGINHPFGTGFFISHDGYFLTAAHVLYNSISKQPNFDLDKLILIRDIGSEIRAGNSTCCSGALHYVDYENDIALLRVSDKVRDESWLVEGVFPHLKVSSRMLEEAEPVYSYGYPLSSTVIVDTGKSIEVKVEGQEKKTYPLKAAQTQLCPRITSMIISSRTEVSTSCVPNTYVLDKALNYGNSGGPILSVETGHVHAICRKFQPVQIPQQHMKNQDGKYPMIIIPSLYGIATNLSVDPIISVIRDTEIEVVDF